MGPSQYQVIQQHIQHLGAVVASGAAGVVGTRHVFETEADWSRFREAVGTLGALTPWQEKLTRAELEGYVNDLISFQANGQTAEQLSDSMATMAEALAAQGERLFILPVAGLFLLGGGRLQMGPVTFLQVTRGTLAPLAAELTAHVLLPQRAEAERRLSELLLGVVDSTVAMLTGPHLTARLRLETVQAARGALHVLRGMMVLTHPDPWAVHLAVSGDERGGMHHGIEIAPLGVDASARPLDGGLIEAFTVLDENRLDLSQLGLDLVGRAYAAPNAERTSWQHSLLRAFHWCGNSQLQPDADAALLCLIIALETLFAPGPQGIGGTIADGVAFLTCTAPHDREAQARTVVRIYNLRSRVAHGGSSAVSWQDVHLLRAILREVMHALILFGDQWTDRKELDQHVRLLKYSTP